MVEGLGPMITADASKHPVYVAAPVYSQLAIRAYVGAPVCAPDGTLFGTLCAIDPEPGSEELEKDLPLIRLISMMLGAVLEAELRLHEEERAKERATLAAYQDSLTGVRTRHSWDLLAAAEEERCRVVGASAVVISVDLDDLKEVNDAQGHHAGDLLLARAAHAIVRAVRQEDVVARVGGDEFAVLVLDGTDETGKALCHRISDELRVSGVRASLGWATRMPGSTIDNAWRAADLAMYSDKRLRSAA
jgi:diguanylate cyclase (GGDEF)-like protein